MHGKKLLVMLKWQVPVLIFKRREVRRSFDSKVGTV